MKVAAFETLSLHLLKTFSVFAETGKVEETAKKLGITQASVSLQLKKLEEETGQTLFKTVGRKKLLSAFARDLFQSIAPPLKELELRLKEVSKTQVPVEQRILRIGCRQELIKRVTPHIHFPGQVQISSMTSEEALQGLRNDKIDVAIVPDPKISGEWFSKRLFIDQPVLIIHPSLSKSRSWEGISKLILRHPAVGYKKPAPYLKEIVEKLGGKAEELKIKFYCEDWMGIIDLVKQGPYWSVLPRRYSDQLNGLTVIDIPSKVLESPHIYSVSGKEWRGVSIFNLRS